MPDWLDLTGMGDGRSLTFYVEGEPGTLELAVISDAPFDDEEPGEEGTYSQAVILEEAEMRKLQAWLGRALE